MMITGLLNNLVSDNKIFLTRLDAFLLSTVKFAFVFKIRLCSSSAYTYTLRITISGYFA